MALPVIPLPSSSVEVNGTEVRFRSLSRSEALELKELRGDLAAAEVLIISKATGSTEEEAQTFREGTPTMEAGKLIDAILVFSGLAEEEDTDPKADTNEPSQTEP